jgi:hypothetical protein
MRARIAPKSAPPTLTPAIAREGTDQDRATHVPQDHTKHELRNISR